MKKILLIGLVLLVAVLASGCTGFPKTINTQLEGKIDYQPASVNFIIEKDIALGKIAPEVIERVKSLLHEHFSNEQLPQI